MNAMVVKQLLVCFFSIPLIGCAGFMSPFSPSAAARSKDPLTRLEDSVLFQPTKYPDGDWNPRGANWQRDGQSFEDAWFDSADGTKLHGWYWTCERPRAVVLFCHGNAGNLSHRADLIRYLCERHRLTVMIFDYRGYGRSEGEPDEQGILQDARAARTWLARRAGVAEKDIVLMGRSLGGAVAVDLAASDGARGLILQSTFSSVGDVAATKPLLASSSSLMQHRFNSASKIPHYRGPLLQSHGDADRVIPHKIGLRLFEAANEPKRFVTIPRADHNDPQSAEYYQAFDAFIDSLPPIGASPHPAS